MITTHRARTVAAVSLSLALTAWGTATVVSAPASAGPADCGVHLYPSLDPTGEHASGEILDLTKDGIYVGSVERRLRHRAGDVLDRRRRPPRARRPRGR